MKRLFNYLPLHFVVLGILGICCQFFTEFWKFGFLNLLLLLSILLVFLHISRKISSTVISFCLFFFVGVSSVFFNDVRNYDDYYAHYFTENSKTVLQIHKVLKSGNFHHKYEAKVTSLNDNKVRGRILLNVLKDTIFSKLKVDEMVTLQPVFKELSSPLNPHQFNYKDYLFKQGIHHQVFTKNNKFFKIDKPQLSLFGFSEKLRLHIQKSLQNYHFKNDELAVINALLLGQRQDISKELITDYQNAGAIHILAVSGLHIGVILLFLSFLFQPLERFKNGKYLKTIIIILLLWMFAFVAGLSASVVRAVTMFSFVAVGMCFKQKNSVGFSFISSLFILLLLKPMFLFAVGFQLSYLAVFGILWIQPKLYGCWKPKYKITDFFWQLFTVSIAAQVGILPLSIYYFKQFPGLFLASNLVIVPFLGAILIGGILVIILSLLKVLPELVAGLYGKIISCMNAFVSWISHQESYLFKDISISTVMMILWYFIIFTGVYMFIKKSVKQSVYFLLAIICVQTLFIYENNKLKTKKEFIVFHKSRFSVFGKRVGGQLYLQHNLDSLKISNDYSLTNYRVKEAIENIQKIEFNNYLKFKDKEILVVDSLGIYKIEHQNKPIVILQYSPKINLERLIENIKPSQIIADGSNYKSDVLYWKKKCLLYQVPFYYTGQNGAFVLR